MSTNFRRIIVTLPPTAHATWGRGKAAATHGNFIFRLKIYKRSLNLHIFNLQLYRFRLKIEFTYHPGKFTRDAMNDLTRCGGNI